MGYVCGIDPGWINLGVCVVQDTPFEIVFLESVNLFEGQTPRGPGGQTNGRPIRKNPKIVTRLCHEYVKRHEAVFRLCGTTVVENQMQKNMYAVQYGMEALFQRYGEATSVHPSTVKAYFGTRKGQYKANKRAAVECCRRLLEGVSLRRFDEYVATLRKADDVADAVLLAIYGAQQRRALFQDKTKRHKPNNRTHSPKAKGPTLI